MPSRFLLIFVSCFALVLISLGMIAFFYRSSVASLAAGSVFGVSILIFSYLWWKKNSSVGLWGLLAVFFLQTLSFVERAVSTNKGLPILLGAFSFLSFALIIISQYQNKKN